MGNTIEKIESVAKMLNGRHMPKPYMLSLMLLAIQRQMNCLWYMLPQKKCKESMQDHYRCL